VNPNPNPIGTVVFERTVKVRDYESAKAGVFIQFDINGGGDQLVAAISEAFFQAKAVVFDELGIEFNVDAGGVVRELIDAKFGKVTEVTAAPPVLTAARPVAVAAPPAPVAATPTVDDGQPPYNPATQDKSEKAANARWAKARYQSHPDEFWDNAEAKASGRFSPKSPDFKHKDTGIGVWAD